MMTSSATMAMMSPCTQYYPKNPLLHTKAAAIVDPFPKLPTKTRHAGGNVSMTTS